MVYRLDLHIHSDASPDSRMTLAQAVAAAKKNGLQALAVCDHNRAPAPEVFETPLRGGVLLIPSVEYSTELGHLLGLFLERPCHVAGEQTGRVRFSDAVRAIHGVGGSCVLAHPYELTHRTPEEISAQIASHEAFLDGIEIANCRATKKRANANALAAQASEGFSKPILRTAGSDAHTPREIGGAFVEVEADELSLPALRTALAHPLAVSCGKCKHLAFARSQFIQLRKQKNGVKAYFRWAAFALVCLLRAVKGVFL